MIHTLCEPHNTMPSSLVIVGAPSSAGAYAPGEEKTPAALRGAGLLAHLHSHGIRVEDRGDIPGFRWRADREQPRAMHVEAVAEGMGYSKGKRAIAVARRGSGSPWRLVPW